jgi:tetratricopeptide (TPR) repeat protein
LLLEDASNPDHSLSAALILRHMAELLHKEDLGWDDGSRRRECLEQSLRHDPDDRDTYLQLALLHQEAGNDKDYHHWVEQAVKHFPDDPQVLLAAVKTATARKAHKKAAGFAARVLELDPINSKARAILINAHLAHARKLMRGDKYALAEKELDSAGQLERDNARTGIVEINRGLLALQQGQRDRGRQWLREGVRLAGGPVLAWLRLAVEALRLELDPDDYQRDAALDDPHKLSASRADLLAMAQLINAYREEEVDEISSVVEDLERPLQRAIKALDSEDDLLLVCEALHQAPHYGLLEHAATRALELQPERPLFVYYQIYGRAEGDLDQVKERDHGRLERAVKQATATKDHRAAATITRFFSQSPFSLPFQPKGGGRVPMPMPLPPMPPKMRRELEQIKKELERLPPALRSRMLDQMLDDLPPDDEFPPEIQRVLMKILLLGDDIEDILDELPDDFPPPFPGGREGRKKHRS